MNRIIPRALGIVVALLFSGSPAYADCSSAKADVLNDSKPVSEIVSNLSQQCVAGTAIHFPVGINSRQLVSDVCDVPKRVFINHGICSCVLRPGLK
jgi:hypothetical protein